MGFEPTIQNFPVNENVFWTGDQPVGNPLPNTNTELTHADIHDLDGIRKQNPIVRMSEIFLGRGISPSQFRYLTKTQNERTQTSIP
jgi:hypothetical protein